MADNENPFLEAGRELFEPNTQGSAYAASVEPVSGEAVELARELNLPVGTVERNLPELQALAKRRRTDYQKLAADAPLTNQWLSDSTNMSVAQDDIDSLSGIEQAWGFLKKGGSALASGLPKFNEGIYGAAQFGVDTARTYVTEPLSKPISTGLFDLQVLPSDPLAPVSDFFSDLREGQAGLAGRMMPKGDGNVEQGVYSGLQSLGQNLLTLPAAILSGNPSLALAPMVGGVGGIEYGRAVDKGLPYSQAAIYATSQAAVELATERLPMGMLIKDLEKNTGFMTTVAKQLAAELPSEQVATVLQDLNEWAALNPEKPFSEYIAERPNAALQTAVATAVGTGGMVTTSKAIEAAARKYDAHTGKAAKASQARKELDRLNNLVAGLNLKKVSPSTMAAYAEHVAEGGDVYVDGKDLVNALNQAGIDPNQAATDIPSIGAQLQQSLVTGKDIKIPASEFMAKVAGTDYAQAMLDHIKTDPNEWSAAEAKEAAEGQQEEVKAEVERAIKSKDQRDAHEASAEAVRKQFEDQLNTANRFSKDVNKAYASMISSFYSVTAARLGVTPEDMVKQYPLQVVAEMTQGGRKLDQKNIPASVDIANKITKLQEEYEYDHFGLRVLPMDQDAAVGDVLANSYAWDDGEFTEQELNGVSAIEVISPEKVENVLLILGAGGRYNRTFSGYHGKKVVLIGSNRAEGGSDPGEIVMKDGIVLGIYEKESDSIGDGGGLLPVLEGDNTLNQDAKSPRAQISFADDITKSPTVISLLKGADLSSFLHESGHFFLEVLADISTRPNAPQNLVDDFDAALKWFGVDRATWNGMTMDQKRPYHEQFARGFEAYAFEGKAPSLALQKLFQRFRAWLLDVYKKLLDAAKGNAGEALDVQLTDEVRAVFDRMLATQEQIEEAQAVRGFTPLFETKEAAEKAGVDWERYQADIDQAKQDAVTTLEARSLRDMQWFRNAHNRALVELRKETEEKRKEARDEAKAEISAERVYQAINFLRYGNADFENLTNEQRKTAEQANIDGTKLSLDDLKETYGEGADAIWMQLPRGKNGMVSKDAGLPADAVADLFGYSSGDQMIREILAAPPMSERIESATDQKMFWRYGDITSEAALKKAADEAIHNEMRAKVLATEANALAAELGQKKLLTSAVKLFASNMLARMRIADIKPDEFTSAESKAAVRFEKARKKGNTKEAALEKRNQLINNHAARLAYEIGGEIDKSVKYLRKFERDGVRKGLSTEYLDQIDALLDRFDLKKSTSLKALDERATLNAWIEEQQAMGIEPDIDPKMKDERYRKHYKTMSLEEFRGLIDTVKQIEHLGRVQQKLLTATDNAAFAEVVDTLAASIKSHAGDKQQDLRTRNVASLHAIKIGKQFLAMHRKMASVARELDGGKDNGPVWQYFIRSMNEAGDREAVMREQATIKLDELARPILKGDKMSGKGRWFPSVNMSLNREERISIALNTGNEGNLQRLLDGEGWTMDQIQPVLDTLTKEEWDFVQSIWDFFESYRPQIAEKEKRVYGKEPDWVAPVPVQTKHGQYRGGYYPIKYDPQRSIRAEQNEAAETAKQQLKGAFTSSTTRRSFTKTRADKVRERPLLYSFGGIYQGSQEVIHDLAWHEWLIDVNRLLRNQALDGVIRNAYGPETVAIFKNAVQDIAAGDVPAANVMERGINHIRVGATVAGLGWNVVTSMLQPLGLTQSMVRVGPGWVAKGVAQWLKSPVDKVAEIYEKSDFMRLRGKTFQREINEIANKVSGGKSQAKTMLDASYFVFIQKMQLVADVPTWLGAYEKAFAEGVGEDRAIELADQAVRDSQGGGQISDLAQIQRGSPYQKLFTNFYSFFNVAYNLGVERTKATNFKDPKQVGRLAVDYLLLYSIPAVLGALLKDALTGGGDDDEELAKKLVNEQISYLLGMMVGLREVSAVVQKVAGVQQFYGSYSGPAGLRFFQELDKLGTQASQGEADMALFKSINNTAGILFHLPSGQINKTVEGALAVMDDTTDNPLAPLVGAPKK